MRVALFLHGVTGHGRSVVVVVTVNASPSALGTVIICCGINMMPAPPLRRNSSDGAGARRMVVTCNITMRARIILVVMNVFDIVVSVRLLVSL